jgi:hypothetical protein
MSITLTEKDYDELLDETALNNMHLTSEPFEWLLEVPKNLGKGYLRGIEVYPNVSLKVYDFEYHDDLFLKLPLAEHPLQFAVYLSGIAKSPYGQLDNFDNKPSSYFFQNPLISSLKAFKNKRAYIVKSDTWWSYGPLGMNKLLDELPKYLLEGG